MAMMRVENLIDILMEADIIVVLMVVKGTFTLTEADTIMVLMVVMDIFILMVVHISIFPRR